MHSPPTLLLLLLLGLVTAVLTSNLDHLGHHHGHHDQHAENDQHRDGQDHQDHQDQRDHRDHQDHRDHPDHQDHRDQPDGQQPAAFRTIETAPEPPFIPNVRLDSHQSDEGSFGYQAGNQIQAAVEGYQRRIRAGVGTVKQGEYSYVSSEGRRVRVKWTADENGFTTSSSVVTPETQ